MTQTGSACGDALMRPRRAAVTDLDGGVPDAVRGAGNDPGRCVAEEFLRPGATPESALVDGLNRHFRAAGGCETLISDLIRKVREIEDREREGRS